FSRQVEPAAGRSSGWRNHPYGRNRQLLGISGGYLSLPELRNKATDQCDQKQCSARHQDKAMSSVSPDRVCFMFVGATIGAAGISSSCAHIYREVCLGCGNGLLKDR